MAHLDHFYTAVDYSTLDPSFCMAPMPVGMFYYGTPSLVHCAPTALPLPPLTNYVSFASVRPMAPSPPIATPFPAVPAVSDAVPSSPQSSTEDCAVSTASGAEHIELDARASTTYESRMDNGVSIDAVTLPTLLINGRCVPQCDVDIYLCLRDGVDGRVNTRVMRQGSRRRLNLPRGCGALGSKGGARRSRCRAFFEVTHRVDGRHFVSEDFLLIARAFAAKSARDGTLMKRLSASERSLPNVHTWHAAASIRADFRLRLLEKEGDEANAALKALKTALKAAPLSSQSPGIVPQAENEDEVSESSNPNRNDTTEAAMLVCDDDNDLDEDGYGLSAADAAVATAAAAPRLPLRPDAMRPLFGTITSILGTTAE